ncbi:hypothetical protein BVY02_01060 [bacterium J17]|nr:hypothetical protein BVY02_01060 [bacterium J17]
MFKRILLPLEPGSSDTCAISIASSLAGLVGAELVGLVVEDESRFMKISTGAMIAEALTAQPIVGSPRSPEEAMQIEEQMEKESQELISQFEACSDKADIDARFVVLRGNPTELTLSLARTVDMIVIGNSKLQGPQGVSADRLLHTTTRPVLVVPEDAGGESSLVIGYDGSAASERVIRLAANIAEAMDLGTVHLLTIDSDLERAEKVQAPGLDYLSAYDFDLVPVCLDGEAAEEIISYAKEVDASIVALGAFGTNRFIEKVFGSTTQTVLDGAPSAVLLVS